MSELKVKGTITEVLKVESGTSKAGKDWQKMTFVIDTGEQYNPLVAFSLFGQDKVENFNKYNKVGSSVEVSFNVSSREHDGKWYNSLDAWKIWSGGEASANNVNKKQPVEDESDSLPF